MDLRDSRASFLFWEDVPLLWRSGPAKEALPRSGTSWDFTRGAEPFPRTGAPRVIDPLPSEQGALLLSLLPLQPLGLCYSSLNYETPEPIWSTGSRSS